MRDQSPSQPFEITYVSENDASCFVTVSNNLYTIELSFSLTIQPTTAGHFEHTNTRTTLNLTKETQDITRFRHRK